MKVIALLIITLVATTWLYNFYKLTECDFFSPYKCEFVHGAGFLVPPFAFVTVWFGTETEQSNPQTTGD